MKWPLVKIDEIKASGRNTLVGGPFGSNLTAKDYTEDGVPVIRGVNRSWPIRFDVIDSRVVNH
jgi:type I restriction enzyme, S subunit